MAYESNYRRVTWYHKKIWPASKSSCFVEFCASDATVPQELCAPMFLYAADSTPILQAPSVFRVLYTMLLYAADDVPVLLEL
jgi:hypothetical protein